MLGLNQKGQASSTFQLLIAAIVALAILGVLISVIGGIGGISGDPTTATKQLLRNQVNNPGAESCTDPVEFSAKKNKSLAAQGITKDSGLDSEQVFFGNQDGTKEVSNFDPNETGTILQYTSQSSKKVVICIICSEGAEGLASALEDNDVTGISVPGELADVEDETLCAVYPKKTA